MAEYDYKYLKSFFSAYFTNFWVDEVDNSDPYSFREIVQRFVSRANADRIAQTTSELKILIDDQLPEEVLRQVITRELGANIYPPGIGLTYQEWLEDVLQMLEDV